MRWIQGFEVDAVCTPISFSFADGSQVQPCNLRPQRHDCCIAHADPTRQFLTEYLTTVLQAGVKSSNILRQMLTISSSSSPWTDRLQ